MTSPSKKKPSTEEQAQIPTQSYSKHLTPTLHPLLALLAKEAVCMEGMKKCSDQREQHMTLDCGTRLVVPDRWLEKGQLRQLSLFNEVSLNRQAVADPSSTFQKLTNV